MTTQEIEISVGIIKENSSYLCIKRNTSPYKGFIEFPGGKKHSNESSTACLVREIKEELNISLKKFKYIGFIKHLYGDRLIKINIFKIFKYVGILSSNENRDIVYYKKNSSHKLLPTHSRIINTLQTPKLIKIIHKDNIMSTNNLDLSTCMYLRLRGISYDTYKDALKNKLECSNFSGKIIVDYPYSESWQTKKYGIHYTSNNIQEFNPINRDKNIMYSASCHTANEINECNQRLFDFILLSPLLESHNKYNILGWSKFSTLCLSSFSPTLALGGLSSSGRDFTECIKNYGFGIAGIRNI